MSSFEIPEKHTALLQGEGGSLVIARDVPLPTLGPGHILVKTAAVALNPCDFKTPAAFPNPGYYNGCDFAGTVVALGSDNIRDGGPWKIGDRVFGAIHGANPSDWDSGSHAEYVKAVSVFSYRIPDWMTFEEAAGLSPCCIATMGVSLFKALELPGTFEEPATKPMDVLIYGGSSSVGSLGIQMVKLLGHRCITTCSPKNFYLVKSYGADEVFDYKSPTCAPDIRKATRNCLKYAVDPFGEVKTMAICTEAIGRAGGRYSALEKFQEDVCDRKTVKRELTMGAIIIGHGLDLGGRYTRPHSPEMRAWGIEWYKSIQRLVDARKFKPHPIRVLKGGFEDMLEGLAMLKRREISAEKLVVSLDPAVSGLTADSTAR
ncbi:chaperonin 10-like protein [Chaetomium tenue]|uniref:Chaperonin 10-like protein n=1 Tax=Chaetomium tenue TaxID=1854479 RepID=A0ACB7PRS9_9PEZI|nr:chaperonin 10-like protein [Chaetomium globosum]